LNSKRYFICEEKTEFLINCFFSFLKWLNKQETKTGSTPQSGTDDGHNAKHNTK
jgi:hypothetical protein